ncbi:MAG TPA: hypothetical protein VN963_07080 [bacterium]|nr:hypothetical protein [bacterium]
MKHATPVLAITLLLGALGLTSCAGDKVQSPEPPVTALKAEPTSVPETTQVPAVSAAPQADEAPVNPSPASPKAVVPAAVAPAVQTNPVASTVVVPAPPAVIPVVAKADQNPWSDNKGWFWLLILLLLLLLLAAAEWIRSRYRRNKLTAAKKVPLAPPMVPAESPLVAGIPAQKEIMVTAFFNDKEHKMHFSPATTVKKVTAWAAYQCGIFDHQTTEVYVAIHGYSAPLTGTAHIGRFVEQGKHHLELDVMTFKKEVLADEVILSKDTRPAPEVVAIKSSELADDEVLVHGAGMADPVKVSVKPNAPFQEVITSTARIGKFPEKNAFIFSENETTPLDASLPLDAKHPRHKILHVHPQKEIIVTAFFHGKEHKMRFSPATTIKKVTAWAAYQSEIFDRDTTEVFVAIHGYSAPLTGTAHIGRFVTHDQDHLELDVITFEKVNA